MNFNLFLFTSYEISLKNHRNKYLARSENNTIAMESSFFNYLSCYNLTFKRETRKIKHRQEFSKLFTSIHKPKRLEKEYDDFS